MTYDTLTRQKHPFCKPAIIYGGLKWGIKFGNRALLNRLFLCLGEFYNSFFLVLSYDMGRKVITGTKVHNWIFLYSQLCRVTDSTHRD